MRKGLKLGSVLLAGMFALTGCMKMNVDFSVADGKVDLINNIALSPDLASGDIDLGMGESTTQAEKLDLASMSEEELLELCKGMDMSIEDNGKYPDAERVEEAGLNEDGWLECRIGVRGVDIEEFTNGDSEEGISEAIQYDKDKGTYVINMGEEVVGDLTSSMDETDASQLAMMKSAGVEMGMTFTFKNINKVMVGTTTVKEGETVNGVSLNDNSAYINILDMTGENILIEASDSQGANMTLILAVVGGALLLLGLGGAIFVISRRNKNVEAEQEYAYFNENAPTYPNVAQDEPTEMDAFVSGRFADTTQVSQSEPIQQPEPEKPAESFFPSFEEFSEGAPIQPAQNATEASTERFQPQEEAQPQRQTKLPPPRGLKRMPRFNNGS